MIQNQFLRQKQSLLLIQSSTQQSLFEEEEEVGGGKEEEDLQYLQLEVNKDKIQKMTIQSQLKQNKKQNYFQQNIQYFKKYYQQIGNRYENLAKLCQCQSPKEYRENKKNVPS
ncbi:hypothetical protein ABPG72_002881 [Tetrahymena utriculariae]